MELNIHYAGRIVPVKIEKTGIRIGEILVPHGNSAVEQLSPKHFLVGDRPYYVQFTDLHGFQGVAEEGAGSLGPIHPPMSGTLVSVAVKKGQKVAKGDLLFVLEAMKMQNEIRATAAGVVTELRGKAGMPLGPKDVVLVLSAS